MDKVLIVLRRGCEELAEQLTSRKFKVELVCDVLTLHESKMRNIRL